MEMKRSAKILTHIGLILIAAFIALPFVWMILTSLKTLAEAEAIPPKILPEVMRIENYTQIFKEFPFAKYYMNTIIVTVSSIILQLIIVTPAAYAFARIDFKFKNTIFLVLMAAMMVPGQMYLIPQYQIIQDLGLLNSLTAIVLPGIFSIYYTFLLRQHFKSIPTDMEEAAIIDGASQFTIFFKLMVPIVRPALGTVAILAGLGAWNSFLWPIIVNSDPSKLTLAAGLRVFVGQYGTHYPRMMAGAVLSTIPMIVVFAIFQKKFISSIAVSAGKE
ncbi:MAG: carbohydrate ABC transporter permease [Romboutsia sp.]|uniref:carbohydrate ABC transporter permease n=1 Tax=Romboutsia sp. TaxID=1965302 RepID=UPI003F3B921E